ncbi:Hypothetical protein GSB_151601, partial [Giardia duodenalis]
VSVPPPVEGVQRGAGDQDTQPSPRPEPEAGHLAIDKCKTIDGASLAPPDGPLLQREAQEVQGRDPPPSPAAPRSSTRTLKSSRSEPPSPSHTWPRRPTST